MVADHQARDHHGQRPGNPEFMRERIGHGRAGQRYGQFQVIVIGQLHGPVADIARQQAQDHTAADLAGVSRLKYAANIRVIRIMCSGRVDPQFILDALARGADGVLIGGCHPGDCHYVEGNYKMLRRFRLLRRMLSDMGIEPERVRLEWISAAEGDKVKLVINEMSAQLSALGPLNLPGKAKGWDAELTAEREAVHA